MLGTSIVPAVIVNVGAASIPDTPNSFALRGRLDEARDSLRCIRRAWAATATSTPSSRISLQAEEDRRYEVGAMVASSSVIRALGDGC